MENEGRVRLREAVRRHGFNRLCREAGISPNTLAMAVKGFRTPRPDTCRKIGHALGVPAERIDWKPRSEDGLYADAALRARIDALVEDEVEKRLATRLGEAS